LQQVRVPWTEGECAQAGRHSRLRQVTSPTPLGSGGTSSWCARRRASSTPAHGGSARRIATVPNVWRKSWKRSGPARARANAAQHRPRSCLGCTGRPCSSTNIRSSSSTWCSRWPSRALGRPIWRGQDSNLRRLSQPVYSRSPLTTRTPRRGGLSLEVVASAAARKRPAGAALPAGPRASSACGSRSGGCARASR
jgi:hypothetical protein